MKYVAFLRGINVGGNNLIKMSELVVAFEKSGHTDVKSYINSGNIIFASDEKNIAKLTTQLEALIMKAFKLNIPVLVVSHDQLKAVVASVPSSWNKRDDLRCYIAFMMPPLTTDEALPQIDSREGVDTIDPGPGALYLTTLMAQRTKSALSKMMGKKIYKQMTIRNYTTTKKLLSLMA